MTMIISESRESAQALGNALPSVMLGGMLTQGRSNVLQGNGTGCLTLWIGDVGRHSVSAESIERISLPGGTPPYWQSRSVPPSG